MVETRRQVLAKWRVMARIGELALSAPKSDQRFDFDQNIGFPSFVPLSKLTPATLTSHTRFHTQLRLSLYAI